MATSVQDALTDLGTHAVGSLHSLKVHTVTNGATIITASVDQFTLVEIDNYLGDNGVPECAQLSDKTLKAYLVATPEQRYLDEPLATFYNAVGDKARLIILEPFITRFSTSAWSFNAGVTVVVRDLVAHFDVATKEYILSTAGAPHADYATSSAQFVVVGDLDDTSGEYLVDTVRLMCIAS